MAITKPPVLPPWADTAVPGTDIVQPTNPEISAGWLQSTTPPSRQRFNWVLNFCANAVRYFSRRGVVDWDSAETYQLDDIVRGDNGLLYRSIQNNNTNRLPSAVLSSWWGPINAVTPATGDNSTKIATTAYVQASITGKANTSGTYSGMTVGNATNAASAAVAASAGAAPWAGITGKPSTVGGYGITDAITTANIGAQSVNFANSAGRAYPYRWDGNPISIIWSGQGGQPNWLLGSNDGTNFYVYNPSNFSVNYATNAAYASTLPTGTSDTRIATTQFANPAQSRASNGYVMLPGGLIMQWGSVVFGDLISGFGANVRNITFPTTFPNAPLQIICGRAGTAISAVAGARFLSSSGFQLVMEEWSGVPQGGDNTATWFAIGH